MVLFAPVRRFLIPFRMIAVLCLALGPITGLESARAQDAPGSASQGPIPGTTLAPGLAGFELPTQGEDSTPAASPEATASAEQIAAITLILADFDRTPLVGACFAI